MEIWIQVGQFPQLVSQDKAINGKLMGNRTHCLPGSTRSHEKYSKSVEEKSIIKEMRKNCTFQNKRITLI
jgi:hypothetical protein